MKILIAEDEQRIAETYKIILEDKGHNVVATNNGKTCIDSYTRELEKSKATAGALPFDVVLLDYRMPIMDGMEAARNILSLRPEQRIIFASAYLKETLLDSLRQLNRIIELLSKPFSLPELVEAVEDEHLYKQLQVLNVDISRLKSWNPTYLQISTLLNGIMKLRNINVNYLKEQTQSQEKGS